MSVYGSFALGKFRFERTIQGFLQDNHFTYIIIDTSFQPVGMNCSTVLVIASFFLVLRDLLGGRGFVLKQPFKVELV